MRGKGRKRRAKPCRPAVLVFGEDDNDRQALVELMRALRSDLPRIEKRASPPVLVRGREKAKARKNAIGIAQIVRADSKRLDVRLVVAHEDCDEIEPAHEALSERIEALLGEQGIASVAATPAWEMEAWWYLWPDAVTAVNSRWRRPARSGARVGLIVDAKEQLRRDLRPKRKSRQTRDYEESDAPKIARNVRELGLIDEEDARSDSYARFRRKLAAAKL